ncbi:MAG: S9 family peptidase [Bacteroidota bacterium]
MKLSFSFCMAMLLGALLAVPQTATAQDDVMAVDATAPALQGAALPPLLDRDLFFGDPEIAGGTLSPDASMIAFSKPYAGVMNVWVKDRDADFESARALTADDRPVGGYRFSQDNRYLLYVQDKGGNEDFHVYAVDLRADADDETGVPPARNLTDMEGVRALIYDVPKDDPANILVGLNDRDPAWHDVYRLNLETGERTLLIENTEQIAGWMADLDGEVRLALRTDPGTGETQVRPIGGDGSIGETIYTCSVIETCSPVRFHPDGDKVYMITNTGDRDLIEFVLFDLNTQEETLIERDPEGRADFAGARFSDETNELRLTYYNGDRVRLYPKTEAAEADLAFLRESLPDGEIYPGSTDRSERYVVVRVTRAVDPGSRYLFDREARTVTKLYTSRPELPVEHMAPMQVVRYEARDGMEIPAYLTLPQGVEAANLPVVMLIHGGPWARDSYGYDSFAQFMANRGYAVMQPNFRGSTGYGKAFLNAGNREWGTGAMQHDITDGVQYLIDQGIADTERVAIMGGSYGGYATLAGVAFTPDLYAAGVSIVGPSNIITLLESIPPYWEAARTMFATRVGDMNDPEERAMLEAQSPLNSADQITSPLLVIQGANDPRVKQRESDQIVVALRDRGFPVEYMVAMDEGHGFRGRENRTAMFAKVEAFLADHVGGRYQADMPEDISTKLGEIMVDPATVTVTDPNANAGTSDLSFENATLTPRSMTYNVVMNIRGQAMPLDGARRIITAIEHEGQPAYAIVDHATLPAAMGGMALRDSFVVAQGTLKPLARTMNQGQMSIEMGYSDATIEGLMSAPQGSMPMSMALDAPVVADGLAMEAALGTLPLEVGYTAQYSAFAPATQQVQDHIVTVTGMETVEVPAGTFETFVVEIDKVDATDDMTLYIDAETRVGVKSTSTLPAQMGGGTVVSELTSMADAVTSEPADNASGE